ncbi:MAG: hypothetical protein KA076_06575 [Candidatus Marinimicrobia bacterium]|nr:hypothetical protein [Candidatus Neomarinimicrobiota bacterium]
MKRAIFWLVILLIWFGNTAVAQITLRGFILNQDMFQANESMDVMLIRNRLRLNTETFGENVYGFASLDITNDIADSTTTLPNLREVYIDIYSNWLDLRIGKQQVVWGKTDGYFINDIVNPLDLSYFLLQDFDDIRMATTMLNAKLHYSNHSLEVLVIPEFKPMNLLFEGAWGYKRPQMMEYVSPLGTIVLPLHYQNEQIPDLSLKNAEYGLKLNTWFLRTDLAFLYLRSREDKPVYFTELVNDSSGLPIRVDLTPTHPWQNFFGLNFSKPIGAFVFRGEGGYYPERHFNTQDMNYLTKGMIIERPFLQFMLGGDYQLTSALDLSVQGINERILDYKEGIQADENVTIGTVMLRGHFVNETVSPLILVMYNFEDYSSLTRLSIDWNYADSFTITAGVDLLAGKSDTIFGMFAKNDNVYLKFKYAF